MPFWTEKEEPSYDQEFEHALKRVISEEDWKNILEARLGERLEAVILFGSLSNKPPRMNSQVNAGILDSDADIFLLFSGKQKPLMRERVIEGSLSRQRGFSPRIPNAHIVVMNVNEVKEKFAQSRVGIQEFYAKAQEYLNPDYPIAKKMDAYHRASGTSEEAYRVMLLEILFGKLRESQYHLLPQMILSGTTLQGEISTELLSEARQVYERYKNCQEFILKSSETLAQRGTRE